MLNELVCAFSRIHQIHSIYDANESNKCRLEVRQCDDRLLLNNDEMGLGFRSNANMWWDAGDCIQVNYIILQR